MSRLYLVVEGQTEEMFCKRVLRPHFWERHGVDCRAMLVRRAGGSRGGGRSWQPWERHLRLLLSEQRDPGVRVSTLLDLYGAPRDTPGFEPKLSGTALADRMLAAMGERIGDSRFLPYIQVHEFEALVFASLEHLPLITADGRAQAALATELARCENPEALDGGSETAPSKRLKRQLPFYDKVAHGADLTAAAGLNTLRERCPRFGAWVTALEASVTGFASP